MESEILKFLMDYGLAFVVMAGIIWWLATGQSKRLDKNTETVQQNNDSIDDLTHAITALTNNTSKLYETCERAFEDNRRTLEVLIKHIEKENQ
ncbi:MAG: hypothetical protein ACI4UF_06670 [Thermoguttaceae bacterium]